MYGTKKLTTQEWIERVKQIHDGKYNYSKVKYENYDTKVCIICPEHGEFWQTPDRHLQGQGCPKCQHQQSKQELEIIEFLKLYVKPEQIVERDRELLEGYEVDILLPDFHVGIEYHGLYWHTNEKKQDANYHKNKMLLANQKGYRLIQIFEDEWLEHKEIVLNTLRHAINGDVEQCTIGARKTIVGQINGQIAKVFLEQYHIQGFMTSNIYLGSYYGDELVGVMSFNEEQPKMWSLTRFATKTDYKLPGLASKMFKYFKTNFEFDEVKTFLDLRWNQSLNNNTVYDKLGFQINTETMPQYQYVVQHKRIQTVMIETIDRKIEKIYDCGFLVYKYTNKTNN